jgi:type I restriction enzyme, R subunit
MTAFTESVIEQAALDWFTNLGYSYAFGPEIACDGEHPERGDYQEALLLGRLREAIARLNPSIPATVREEALRRMARPGKPALLLNNHACHTMLVNGIEVEYLKDGRAVNGTIRGLSQQRRPDMVIFVNGLPRQERYYFLPSAPSQKS